MSHGARLRAGAGVWTNWPSRYAANLANGRFLWRNRVGAEQVEVQVRHLVGGRGWRPRQWTFDALSLPLRSAMPRPEAEAA
jgi:CRISPR-associated protein Csy3